AERWDEVCQMYAEVNQMFGDIIKVTPTSKVVGDMALFMVGNNLRPEDVLNSSRELSFPASVVEFFEGKLGQPYGGFPQPLKQIVLRGRLAMTDRPGAQLPSADLAATKANLEKKFHRPMSNQSMLADLLYPRVFPEFVEHQSKYSDTSVLPTPVFFTG